MIDFYDQVPTVYNNHSRDFQYMSWLINIVLNTVKHNVDDLYQLPNMSTDPRLTELLAFTLGFKVKRKYDQKQLMLLVSILPNILKYKGTKKAVDLVGFALVKAAGIDGVFKSELNNNCLEIQLPTRLVDTTLFMDLLPYILPAGITVKVVTQADIELDALVTRVQYQEDFEGDWFTDLQLAELFEIDQPVTDFSYVRKTDDKDTVKFEVNSGLLDSSLIPTLDVGIVNIEQEEEDS